MALAIGLQSGCENSDGSAASSEAGDSLGEAPCIDRAELDAFAASCTEKYLPRWSEIYRNEFAPQAGQGPVSGCGYGGGECHAQATAAGVIPSADASHPGFLLSADSAQTHAMLLGGDPPYIDLAQPECSQLIERLQTKEAQRWMPPNPSKPYDEWRRCTIVHWILSGAPYDGP